MKDYGPQYQKAGGRRQKVVHRDHPGGWVQAGRTWLWRATGLLALVATIIGVGGSLWFGYRINSGLDELAGRQSRLVVLQKQHQHLLQRRDALLAEKRIEALARKMGLYPPTHQQIKKL